MGLTTSKAGAGVHDRSEGFPEPDISSLHAMGYGSGQIEKLSARRRRRRRRRHLILPGGAAPPDPPFKSAYRPP